MTQVDVLLAMFRIHYPSSGKRSSLNVFIILIVLVWSQFTSAFIPSFVHFGSCGNLPTVPDFNPIKYQGWWWDIERVPNEYQTEYACINQNITWEGDSLMIVSRGLSKSKVTSSSWATLRNDGGNEAGLMAISSPGVPSAPYQVVGTDYTEYACVYSCLQLPVAYAELYFTLGRQPVLPENARNICRTIFSENGVDTSSLEEVQHNSSCPYSKSLEQMLFQNKKLFSTFTSDLPVASKTDGLSLLWHNNTIDGNNTYTSFDYNDYSETYSTDFYMSPSVSAGIISMSVVGVALLIISIVLGRRKNGLHLNSSIKIRHEQLPMDC